MVLLLSFTAQVILAAIAAAEENADARQALAQAKGAGRVGESFTGWVLRVAAGLRLHGRRLGRLLEELRPEHVALRVDRVLVEALLLELVPQLHDRQLDLALRLP